LEVLRLGLMDAEGDAFDVLLCWRKFWFARRPLGREVTPMITALSAEEKVERLPQFS